MLLANSKKLRSATEALGEVLSDCRDVNGLKIKMPDLSAEQLEVSVISTLMALTGWYIMPDHVQFYDSTGYAWPHNKEHPVPNAKFPPFIAGSRKGISE